uniref:C-type lectin domain-containing protein n=1 Tax=Sinocyclocheilus rhinocerous TaxID=307959 RepID=A0A673I1L3_9TELE
MVQRTVRKKDGEHPCGALVRLVLLSLIFGISENQPPVNNVAVSKTANFTVLLAVGQYHFFCMEVFELILVQQESTWEEALQYCRRHYTDLAVLSSDVIMAETMKKSTAAQTDDVWIGLRFIAGHWFWVNGADLQYKVWSSGGELQCPALNQYCGV